MAWLETLHKVWPILSQESLILHTVQLKHTPSSQRLVLMQYLQKSPNILNLDFKGRSGLSVHWYCEPPSRPREDDIMDDIIEKGEWKHAGSAGILPFPGGSVVFESNTTRVAEVGSPSCTAKSPTKPFAEGAFANFRDKKRTFADFHDKKRVFANFCSACHQYTVFWLSFVKQICIGQMWILSLRSLREQEAFRWHLYESNLKGA